MSFSKDIAKFRKKTMKRANDFKRGVGIELFSSVILDTPVDTGRARGNWQTTLNTPAAGETEQSAGDAVSVANKPGNFGELNDVNYLTNNLPYIEALEYGSSKQAPAGMARKNVARIREILDRQLRKVKR